MSNEIKYELGETGQALYAVVRNAAGDAWNGSAFVTYDEDDRENYDLPMPEYGTTGFYGPIDLPGTGAGRWWQIYQRAGGTPAHDDQRLATGELASANDVNVTHLCGALLNPVVPDDMRDGFVQWFESEYQRVEAIHTIIVDMPTNDEMEALLQSGIAIGTVVATDFSDESVPANRTWTAKAASGAVLEGDKTLSQAVGTTLLFACDFKNDMASGDMVQVVSEPTIFSGSEDGVTFGATGREDSQAKVLISAVTAGEYVIEWGVTYKSGSTQKCRTTLEVLA